MVFGRQVDAKWLNQETIGEVLADAAEKATLAAEPDIECIIAILDQVGKSWADPEYHLRRQAAKILPGLTLFSPAMIEEGFAVVSAICSRQNLEKRLRGELGDPAVLDRGIAMPHHGYRLRAVPRGILLHLTAGNVFVGAVDSLVSGIITKNANILKMSRVDPVFPLLFIESIKEHDPAGIIWPNQAALLWKGGDAAVENTLLQAPITVVFWGGHDALLSLKGRIGASTRLIENGPRYSFAVVDGRRIRKGPAASMIRGLALDLCRWDQQACSSPHVVYVIDHDIKTTHLLAEALYDELVQLREELPTGELSFDEKVEIRKVRELARMSQARGEGRLICPEDFSFTLVIEHDSAFKVSCLNRTLFFKQTRDLDTMLEQVRPLAAYLQTAGIYCDNEMATMLENELFATGVKRITEIGGMSEGHDGAPHEGSFLLRGLVEWVDVEYLGNSASRVELLLKQIQASPYYRNAVEKAGGCGFEYFHKLPLLDRETFYRNSPPESEAILTGPMTDSYVYASGGTTGSPKFTFYSNDEYRYVTDVLTDIYRNAGICSSDRVANLFIAGNLWTSFNVAGRALENLGCLNLPVGGASDLENILKYLQIFSVNAVVGLPSIIINLAEEISRRGLPIKIEKILYGGEHLRPQTCDFLREAVGAQLIRSAGYACVDTGPIGWQCLHLDGSIHHVLEEYCYAEILDTVNHQPVGGNTAGEIVATNLNRVLMPVVRYRTGDLGRWVETGVCACGFKGRSFELLGRCDDLLVIGGINLMPVDIAAGLAGLPVSQSFQIAAQTAEGRDRLCLRLEAEKPVPDSRVVEALRRGSYKIAESLAENWMTIVIEWHKPGAIKRNPRTGKLKPVVDERFSSD